MGLSKTIQPKRGYLANILTIPPLIYPFQYNPTQISDSKSLKWTERESISEEKVSQIRTAFFGGDLGEIGDVFITSKEVLGRAFSGAKLYKLESEEDRTVNFKFVIDGREQRPGEPSRRREDGDILGDLAILRSFVYPRMAEITDILAAAFGDAENRWTRFWFNEPPTAVLILGDMSMEGVVKDLKINETMFNADLNPVRAEIEITMIEKIDSISFIVDSIKRFGRTFYHTAYEDIGDVII